MVFMQYFLLRGVDFWRSSFAAWVKSLVVDHVSLLRMIDRRGGAFFFFFFYFCFG
jgi:hypothetical protein